MMRRTFDETKNIKAHRKLHTKIVNLQSILNIDWMNEITFDDLNKPLIAYIATRIYLSHIRAWVPNKLEQQGYYWKKHYNKNYDKKNGIYVETTAKQFGSKAQEWIIKARQAFEIVNNTCF